MNNKEPKTKEKKPILTNGCDCTIVSQEDKLTNQPQWKVIVSNFNEILNTKYPLKTKAIKPEGYKVK